MTRREIAENNFKSGFNCAQSVVLAFIDLLKIDREVALAMSSSFGGGMGRMREVCGTVSGMLMVLGALEGYTEPIEVSKKQEYYATIQALAGKFREKNGSIICRDLLGLAQGVSNPKPEERTPDYYKKRPCALLCGDAAEILEEHLKEKGIL